MAVEVLEKTDQEFVENVEQGNIDGLAVKRINGSEAFAAACSTDPPKPFSKPLLILYSYCVVGFLCSCTVGYDSSLMASLTVMKPFQDEFGSSVVGAKIGIMTTMFSIGGIAAIPFISVISDRYGRRLGMFIGSISVILGTIIQGTSAQTHSLGQYMGGRFLVGFGSSFAGACAPSWICEAVHPKYRGVVTGCYNCFYSFGDIIAAGITRGTVRFTTNQAWLIPVWFQLIFPGTVVLFVWLIPESPRWQYTNGKQEKAKAFLTKYHGNGNPNNAFVILQLLEFEESLELDGADKRWWDYRALIKTRSARYRVACNMFFSSVGQLSSGGISYFVGGFYRSAGITDPTTVLNFSLGRTFLSFTASYTGASLCDRVPRRKLILSSLGGICCTWVAVAITTGIYANTGSSAAAKAGIAFYFIFCFFYAYAITPLQGLYCVEVLSYSLRLKGMQMSALTNNVCLLINQFGTPVALQRIGYKTYIIWACYCCLEWIISYFLFVETLGYTLEELDAIFESKNPRKTSTERRKVVVDTDGKMIVEQVK